ncbi:hypothetical protein [Saccharothrix stipae]
MAQVVRDGLSLERLSDAGYTHAMFEGVMNQLVGYPHEERSLRMLSRAAHVPYAAVRRICADLAELGHLTVDAATLPGGLSAHRPRLSPAGLAYWGGPGVAHGWLRDGAAWRDPRLASVMGARLSVEDRARGEVVGYSFPVLFRVADALVLVPSREWRIEDLVTAAGADEGMVRVACLDLAAAGHATAHEWRERGGASREETRFSITLGGLAAWLPWMPDPLDY